VDLEVEQGTEDIDAEGADPLTKFREYIPKRKGVKVPKDPDSDKFLIHTPLFPKHINFEGLHLALVPLLKIEDWDLAKHERFPHLTIENYMRHVHYPDSGVTKLETVAWIHRVENSRLLNLLWVPHYHHTNINTTYVQQLLTLVHNVCLWFVVPIPVTDILIHKITHLPHEGLNPAKEFREKAGERDLAEKMKNKFELVKKSRGYSITSINYLMVNIATQILAERL